MYKTYLFNTIKVTSVLSLISYPTHESYIYTTWHSKYAGVKNAGESSTYPITTTTINKLPELKRFTIFRCISSYLLFLILTWILLLNVYVNVC